MTVHKKNTWQFILNNISNNIAVVLLYVLENKGSSPGRQGFCMAVNAEGYMEGSIGGGIMEHKLVELAKDFLREEKEINILKKQLHHKESATNQSGMICSGEQTVFLYSIKKDDIAIIENIINEKVNTIYFSNDGIEVSSKIISNVFIYNYFSDKDWNYVENVYTKNYLHIIGGGHCSLALSKLMSEMDFEIIVYDTRENLSTIIKNESAFQKNILKDYSELNSIIKERPNTYVIIMTLGYRTDAIAFDALRNKNFTYLKMLGSASKLETLHKEYVESGISENKLTALLQPAGVAIRSQTPQEIAISIAAEIIAVKNKN
jgi:xanthine dehydrogenase accessory factor